MKSKTLLPLLILLTFISSCGILGLYQDNVNPDPDYQAEKIAELGNRPAAIKLDSLIKQIDKAKLMIPEDIDETILIVETYNYDEFLKLNEDKFNIPKDTERERRYFKRYEKKKYFLIKNPKYNTVYLSKSEYDTLDKRKYKYVLSRTRRIDYDPNHLVITNDGFVYSYISTLIFYIYNRESGEVFKEIKDLSILSKSK